MSGLQGLLLASAPYGSLPSGGSGLTVTATPPSSDAGGLSAPYSTPSVTALPSGGSGSYTYAWSVVSFDHTVSITSPTAQTTALRFTVMTSGDYATATVRCTVTDTVSALTGSVDVPMSYQHLGVAP